MSIPGGTSTDGNGAIDLSSRLDEWRRLLLDTSKRNRLINAKFGRGGLLPIVHPGFHSLWEHLAATAARPSSHGRET